MSSAYPVRPLALSSFAVCASPKAIQTPTERPAGNGAPGTGSCQLAGISVLHALGIAAIGGAPTQAAQANSSGIRINRRICAMGMVDRIGILPGDRVGNGVAGLAVADRVGGVMPAGDGRAGLADGKLRRGGRRASGAA